VAASNQNRDAIVELTARERDLIRLHGYPFGRLEADLAKLTSDQRTVNVAMDPFDLEQLIGDLSYSTNHREDGGLQEEFDELCERLESEERRLQRRSSSARGKHEGGSA
jgi:hypothetical protein